MSQKDQPDSSKSHHTLYVNNINDLISRNKITYVLNHLFSQFGLVVEIRIRKSLKMKGQAFVTYQEQCSCEKAIEKLQGRSVFKKPIRISFAKTGSDAFLKLNGDTKELNKRRELREKKLQESAVNSKDQESQEASSKTPELTETQLKQWKLLPPNKVLLLQNLSLDKLESGMLEEAFSKYSGFEKVRLIKFRKLAFIDFELETVATTCLTLIDSSVFGTESLLTYAKK